MAIKIQGFTVIPDETGNTSRKNVAVGYGSLTSITTGVGNVAVGYRAQANTTVGTNNVALGNSALRL